MPDDHVEPVFAYIKGQWFAVTGDLAQQLSEAVQADPSSLDPLPEGTHPKTLAAKLPSETQRFPVAARR
ncbi:hypothetical protein LCGC14_2714610 [marine sediment metagenome]|uniref:Uncharacterized protein n=1 Tax=marine sediment metagenome TaxID=412755 RepID=A0A0F8ZZK1_9ZZZZ